MDKESNFKQYAYAVARWLVTQLAGYLVLRKILPASVINELIGPATLFFGGLLLSAGMLVWSWLNKWRARLKFDLALQSNPDTPPAAIDEIATQQMKAKLQGSTA